MCILHSYGNKKPPWGKTIISMDQHHWLHRDESAPWARGVTRLGPSISGKSRCALVCKVVRKSAWVALTPAGGSSCERLGAGAGASRARFIGPVWLTDDIFEENEERCSEDAQRHEIENRGATPAEVLSKHLTARGTRETGIMVTDRCLWQTG